MSAPGGDVPPGRSALGRRLVLGLVLGLVLYAGMVLWADVDGIRAALAEIDLWVFPAAMGLSFTNYLVRFPRWERYRGLVGIRMPRGTSLLVYLSGLALTVSPGKMGEALKSWLVRSIDGTPLHRSAPIVLAERFTDLLGFVVLLAIGGLSTVPEYAWIFWATLVLCAAGLAIVGSPRAGEALCARIEGLPLLRAAAAPLRGALESARTLLRPRELVLPTLLATAGWGLECTAFWLVANELCGGGVPLAFATYAFALSAVAGAVLIIFPGGLGVTEGTLTALLDGRYRALGIAAGAARAKAASATIVIRLCTLWFAVGVGLVAFALFRRRHGAPAGAPPAP